MSNRLLGKKKGDPGAAKTGITETTTEPTSYKFSKDQAVARVLGAGTLAGLSKIQFWDMPGWGTDDVPTESYIDQYGLPWFDGVIILYTRRLYSMEKFVANQCEEHEIPYYFVRSQADLDIEDNLEDVPSIDAEETVRILHEEMKKKIPHVPCDRRFVLTSKDKTYGVLGKEWERFQKKFFEDIGKSRCRLSSKTEKTSCCGQVNEEVEPANIRNEEKLSSPREDEKGDAGEGRQDSHDETSSRSTGVPRSGRTRARIAKQKHNIQRLPSPDPLEAHYPPAASSGAKD
jgi:hypothetical protein